MSEFNIPFPVNEMATAIAEKLAPLLFKDFKPQETSPPEKYFTRKETAFKLNVSLPTLTSYTQRNLITGNRFGVRVMYKQSDIEAALQKMNFGEDRP